MVNIIVIMIIIVIVTVVFVPKLDLFLFSTATALNSLQTKALSQVQKSLPVDCSYFIRSELNAIDFAKYNKTFNIFLLIVVLPLYITVSH